MIEIIGTHWRRLLALLVVISGVVLAWLSACRRPVPELSERTWSEFPAPPPVEGAAATAPTPEPAPRSAAEPEPVAEPVADAASEPEVVVQPVEPAHRARLFESGAGLRPGPYPGSVLPLGNGSAPAAEYVIKGNAGSMRCHAASSPYFGRTRAQVWFRTEDEAVAVGFTPWTRKK